MHLRERNIYLVLIILILYVLPPSDYYYSSFLISLIVNCVFPPLLMHE